jgi:hypothetical protein
MAPMVRPSRMAKGPVDTRVAQSSKVPMVAWPRTARLVSGVPWSDPTAQRLVNAAPVARWSKALMAVLMRTVRPERVVRLSVPME